jgi:acetyltransferase-like isoleucine patch superfamily enzyme
MRSNVFKLWQACRRAKISFVLVVLRHLLFRARKKNILAGNRVTIHGLGNINTAGMLKLALADAGFMNRYDRTFLNVGGKLHVGKDFSIGRGCRFDIGPHARVSLGSGYVAAQSTFVIMHGLTIGDGCAISWGCQFLDEDFHALTYAGKIEKTNEIVIGARVWIGSNVSVLKGTVVPDGCVVASGAVLTSRFTEKNALIAGNPAKVIRRDISWH